MFLIGGVDWPKVAAWRTSYQMAEVWAQAQRDGIMEPFQSVIMGFWHTDVLPDQVGVNMTHIVNIDSTDAGDLTRATIEGRRQAHHLVEVFRKVVNISSNTIQLGNPNLLHYVVSKGAVATMTRCLARELGPAGIRVNTLVPGFIQSQASKDIMRENHAEGITDAMRAICSLGREQYADDLVGTAVYLCSALSDFVSGQMISVDGGACFTGM